MDSILDAIGNTSLVRLSRCAPPNGAPDAVVVTLAVDTGFNYMSVTPYADI